MYDFDEYQKFTRSTAVYPKDASIVYPTLGLASEAGELAGKLKKQMRDGGDARDGMIAELGDVLWYVACLADDLGVPLSTVAEQNVSKLLDRAARGKLQGSGDNR